MNILRLTATAAALLLSLGAVAHAQTTLRIGLAEDPDVLDPSIARTYVGRIVFASFCDKLFDIDEKLNIVPQLALSYETSADGKQMTIKLRPGVKFHDGETFDAEAAKFSLDRHLTLPTSFRKPELAALDHVDIVDPLTIKLVLKTPYSPLIAQLTDRAGMMVSPKAAKEAGEKFGLHPVCAGPYKFVERVQQDRIVFEKFADYWNKENIFIDRVLFLPIVDAPRCGLPIWKIRRARPDRARAGHRYQGCARQFPAQTVDRARARLSWVSPSISATTRTKDHSASPKRYARRSIWRSTARRSTRSYSTANSSRATNGSARSIPTIRKAFPGSQARPRQGQGAAQGSRCHLPVCDRLHGEKGTRTRRSPKSSSRWRPKRASTSRSA